MSRQKAKLEPVYSAVAVSYAPDEIIRSVTHSEALQMQQEKQAYRFCRLCGRKNDHSRCGHSQNGEHRMVLKLRDLRRHRDLIGKTITRGEMLAVCGLLGGSRTSGLPEFMRESMMRSGDIHQEEDFIERSEFKVKFYPIIGKNNAVRVPGCSPEEFERLRQAVS